MLVAVPGMNSGLAIGGPAASLGELQSLAVDGPRLQSGMVSLSWLPLVGTSSYEVLRGPTAVISSAAVVATNITASQYLDSTPPYGMDLYYWVRAVAGDSGGPWTGPQVARQDVLLWSWSTAGRFTMPVVLTNGVVVFGVNRRSPLSTPPDLGRVYALDRAGALSWEIATGATGLSHPVVTSDDRVLFAIGRDRNHFVWSATASGLDTRETPGVPTTPFLATDDDGTVFLAGQPLGMSTQVRSIDREGTLQWSDGIGSGSVPPRFSIHPDGSLAVGNLGLAVYEVDGRRRWTAGQQNTTWAEPAWVGPNRLMAVNSRQELFAFQADGVALWTNRLARASAPIAGPAVDSKGRSYLTDAGSLLHAIDSDGKRLWQVPMVPPTPFTPVLDQDGRILVGDGGAIAIVEPNGTVLRPLLLPAPASEAPVLTPDGLLLVVVPGQIRAYRHTAGLDTTALWPCARHDARGTSFARAQSAGGVDLTIRVQNGTAILRIAAPPSRVEILMSTDLNNWNLAAEITVGESPVDWTVPSGAATPTYFQARTPMVNTRGSGEE